MKTNTLDQAMDILKKLRSINESAEEITVKLSQIINIIAKSIHTTAAALYVLVDDNYLELFASTGFPRNFDHKISLRISEGLVGEVVQISRSIAAKDALNHPRFLYKDLGGEYYKSFLGSPLLRFNKAFGVIALYSKNTYDYSAQETELLETIAMIVSEIIASDEMTEYKKKLIREKGISEKEKVKGVSLSKGYGIGQAIIHRRRQNITKIFAENKEKELNRLEVSHRQMNMDLDDKFDSSKLGIGEHTEILDAYKMFARDRGWYKKITDHIHSGLTAEASVERAYEDMANRLNESKDVYLKERINDLRDVADRLLSYLMGNYGKKAKDINARELIVVAQILGPAELMDYDYNKIKGLIIEEGTPTMHVAIIAKALNIPVLSKTRGFYEEIKNGELVALDGNDGYIYLNPSHVIQEKFRQKIIEKEKLQAKFESLKKLPNKTLDGTKIGLYLNVGLSFDLDYIQSTNCDGVGLYRTEIPFMTTESMPDVAEQTGYYKELMDKSGNKKVIFRSLDVGSDKLLPYWSSFGEENPAIGWRSIRITLDRRAILRQQVRAFLRAAAGKELNVMFPMISDLNEFYEAKETLLIELEKEKKKSNLIPKKVNVGLMVEVPSLIFQLDSILKATDFISIGTNDLAQFMFACDRGNAKLTERYDVLSPSFLKVMKEIVAKADKHGVYCSVCGEMASNPIEAMVLIGLGYRHLSSSGASFGRVKSMVRSINVKEVTEYVTTLLESSKNTLRPQLIAYAHDHGIEIY